MPTRTLIVALGICVLTAVAIRQDVSAARASGGTDWAVYGGRGGTRYSPLAQSNLQNVKQLRPVWSFDTVLAAQGLTNTGSENCGGPIVTAGGLVFIGATVHDRKFRAFNKTTGEIV